MLKLLWLLMLSLWTTDGGGSDDDPLEEGAPEPEGDDDPADDDGDDDDPEGSGGDDPNFSPEALAEIKRLRRENANRRRRQRDTESEMSTLREQNQAILQALGIQPDAEDDDPSAEAERLRTENRRLRTRQRFDGIARGAGADEDLTWGYLLARGETDSLDPDADDFAEALQERVEAALEAKPSLAVSPAPPSSGGADLDGDNPPDPEDPAEMDMDDFMKWRKKNRDQE